LVGDVEETKKLILASSSPRRSEIFSLLRLDYTVVEPSGCQEMMMEDPFQTVKANSVLKIRNISSRGIIGKNVLIAGFDTLIFSGKSIIGKPRDTKEARSFLSSFSGKEHKVISAVSVLDTRSKKMFSNTEVTVVKFRELSHRETEYYLENENVLDKAGAYNIMGLGCALVESIRGCFYNVAGVPVAALIDLLKRFDYKFL